MARIHPKQIQGRFQVTVDFGYRSGVANPEGDTAQVTILTSLVRSDSRIVVSVDTASTPDHDGEDAVVEGLQVYPANIVAGVSFDVIAYAPAGSWGRYLVNARL